MYTKIYIQHEWKKPSGEWLLKKIYQDIIKYSSWEFISDFKNPTINYKVLKKFVFKKAKELKPELFTGTK